MSAIISSDRRKFVASSGGFYFWDPFKTWVYKSFLVQRLAKCVMVMYWRIFEPPPVFYRSVRAISCLLLTRLPVSRSMATLTSRLRLTRVLRVCHQSCRPVPYSQTLPVNTVLAKDASLPHPLVGALSRFCHNLSGQEEQEIYSGILSTQIKLVKSFSLGTSMIGKCYISTPPPSIFFGF